MEEHYILGVAISINYQDNKMMFKQLYFEMWADVIQQLRKAEKLSGASHITNFFFINIIVSQAQLFNLVGLDIILASFGINGLNIRNFMPDYIVNIDMIYIWLFIFLGCYFINWYLIMHKKYFFKYYKKRRWLNSRGIASLVYYACSVVLMIGSGFLGDYIKSIFIK